MVIIEWQSQKPTDYSVPLTHMSNMCKVFTHTFSATPTLKHVKLIIRRHVKGLLALNPLTLSNPVHVCFTYPHISGRGTHHGWCRGGHDGVREGREGVLVRVLVGVLVLVLVLVELCAQVGGGAQRGAAVRVLRGQETGVELLTQKFLLWKREMGGCQEHST